MKIFDGHNDLLTQLMKSGKADAFATGLPGHIDANKLQTGGMVGGFFAMWVPSEGDLAALTAEMRKDAYDLPLPPPIPQKEALDVALTQAAILRSLHTAGHVTVSTSVMQIKDCADAERIAAILHLEGAEPIDAEFTALDQLYELGLRSLGPVWSRSTMFAEGVPFRYPSSPDTGPGLTPLGIELVERCMARGSSIGLSQRTEAGVWDGVNPSTAPIVAPQSNAHAICPHSRNLTDDQLRAIGESGGVVGLNFATAMLRTDGKMLPECELDIALIHLDHMLNCAGTDSVALGSDFDGAIVPAAIGDAAGLPHLVAAMDRHGYSTPLIEKICFGSWMRVLEATWR